MSFGIRTRRSQKCPVAGSLPKLATDTRKKIPTHLLAALADCLHFLLGEAEFTQHFLMPRDSFPDDFRLLIQKCDPIVSGARPEGLLHCAANVGQTLSRARRADSFHRIIPVLVEYPLGLASTLRNSLASLA